MSECPTVSVAIPVFNEEQVLPELLRRTLAVLDLLPGGPHELVLVDDGSHDGTLSILESVAQDDHRIVVLSLSRNFGHQAALSAALDHVTGDVAILMDADLQDPPETIPRFLQEYQLGFDVVYAVRTGRKESLLLRFCYHVFYYLISLLANIQLPVGAGDFGLISRRCVDLIRQSPERHRYLRGLRTWIGFSQKGIPVERDARQAGEPKYGVCKLFQLAFDGIFAFSVTPLRLATLFGLLSLLFSLCYALYAVYAKLMLQQAPEGFTALIVSVTFLSGIQLVILGILGEYLGRVYEEIKRRPTYIVQKTIRHSEP